MRRRMRNRAGACVAAAFLLGACSIADTLPGSPLGERVVIAQGELAGSDDGDVLRYQGIPYAAPPLGALRWAPPQAAGAWQGVRQAVEPGARCPQFAAPPGTPHATAASIVEDCLTLNVTVPSGTTPSSRLPVLVWLHGGGFNAGAGSDIDPRRLVEAGPLMVVTVNYRLGILGFLGLPGLVGSGSFGLLDQQAAMRWVRQNAGSFGGDPASITLAGESAGADSVCGQLASPGAAGLIARAIMQSGGCGTANIVDVIRPGTGPGGDTWKPLPVVEAAGVAAAAVLGCPDPATALACLRTQGVETLVGGAGTYWSPAVGTPTLPRRPSEMVAAGELHPVAVLAGTNRDEGALFTTAFFDRPGTPVTEATFKAMLSSAAGKRAGDAGRAYHVVDRSPGRAWSDVITDRVYACPGLATYRAMGTRAPLFAYEFAVPATPPTFVVLPADLADAVPHGAEMAFLFDLVPGQPAFDPPQQELADQLVRGWARFVVSGDPTDGDTPWLQWSGDGSILTVTGAGTGITQRPAAEFAAQHHCAVWN